MLVKKGCSILLLATLTGCFSGPNAPVIEITPFAQPSRRAAADEYVVKQKDNLFRIALDHGVTYRDLAAWNNITDVNNIKAGQILRVTGPEGAGSKIATASVKPQPVVLTESITTSSSRSSTPVVNKPIHPSDQATVLASDEVFNVAWPAQGKLITPFTPAAKGIDIEGHLGQPVLAASDGSVVYSGTGLRGYGKMIIIKHNKTYLTAYAHNNKLLVKEGDSVKIGQKIAEMGSSDSSTVKLHFEVRRFGKPVDPLKYLTNR